MALLAAEPGRQEQPHKLPGQAVADDGAAEADHVQVVVLDPLGRGRRIP